MMGQATAAHQHQDTHIRHIRGLHQVHALQALNIPKRYPLWDGMSSRLCNSATPTAIVCSRSAPYVRIYKRPSSRATSKATRPRVWVRALGLRWGGHGVGRGLRRLLGRHGFVRPCGLETLPVCAWGDAEHVDPGRDALVAQNEHVARGAHAADVALEEDDALVRDHRVPAHRGKPGQLGSAVGGARLAERVLDSGHLHADEGGQGRVAGFGESERVEGGPADDGLSVGVDDVAVSARVCRPRLAICPEQAREHLDRPRGVAHGDDVERVDVGEVAGGEAQTRLAHRRNQLRHDGALALVPRVLPQHFRERCHVAGLCDRRCKVFTALEHLVADADVRVGDLADQVGNPGSHAISHVDHLPVGPKCQLPRPARADGIEQADPVLLGASDIQVGVAKGEHVGTKLEE
mmetsp:Transcript_37721/g.121246  ORF Transcript_37721/g.121246 Transcript_37721/m.121246 type:complete len:406 (+) Transcript_37721:110-1327(+)